MNEKLKRTVFAAVFAALTCAATLLIQIPTITRGYVNLGDCVVLTAGWLLGAPWGFAAAGLGSALADIISGYAIFAPGTLVIKGTMAVIAALVSYAFKNRVFVGHVIGALLAEIFMSAGYFVYEWLLIVGTFEAAAAGLPGNILQAAVGFVASVAVITVLEKTKAVKLIRFK